MPVITESFIAGQTKRYSYRGGFFRLLECSNDLEVGINILDSESGSSETLAQVKAGIAVTMPIDYIEITASGGAQTIKFFVGNSRVEYSREVRQFEYINGGTAIFESSVSGSGALFSGAKCGGNTVVCDYTISYNKRSATYESYVRLLVSGVKKVDVNNPIDAVDGLLTVSGSFVISPGAGSFGIDYEYYANGPNPFFSISVKCTEKR